MVCDVRLVGIDELVPGENLRFCREQIQSKRTFRRILRRVCTPDVSFFHGRFDPEWSEAKQVPDRCAFLLRCK